MPNVKHSHKGHRNVHDDAHNNNANGNHVNNHRDQQHNNVVENGGARYQTCCVPTGCADDPIDPADPYDAVKVLCNNDQCTLGNWMHRDCFIEWEQSVLSFLRSCGRARSWSEKQRLQNLWTKKGYDLAYKACDCKCGRGHLRKDLDYFPPPMNDNAKKARKNKKKNDKPMPVVSTNHKAGHNTNGGNHHIAQPVLANGHIDNHVHHHHQPQQPPQHLVPIQVVDNVNKKKTVPANGTTTPSTDSTTKRRGSDNTINNNPSNSTTISTVSSKPSSNKINGTSSNDNKLDNEVLDNSAHHQHHNGIGNVSYNGNHPLVMPMNGLRLRTNSMSSTGSVGSQASSSGSIPSSAGSTSPLSSSPTSNGNVFFKAKKSADTYESNQPGIFKHRQDFSAFNALPRYKQNPYNIHIEDVQEDEDTRNFVLSNLSTKRMTALRCVLCKTHLPVFDRFPLVDGTMFLSPQAYDQFVVQVIWEGRIQFLNSVCIGCLEGASEAKCSACKTPWDGSSLVVGTMYTYDIFAAMPCCQKRLTCKHCRRAVIDVANGLTYYSEYSRMIICPYCKANDYHFIRPLPDTFCVKESSICSQS